MEVTLLHIPFESQILWKWNLVNTGALYDKHFCYILGSMMETGNSWHSPVLNVPYPPFQKSESLNYGIVKNAKTWISGTEDNFSYLKICFWSVTCTAVILHSQWHYWPSLLHKGYPLYKFPSHTISLSWITSGGRDGVYPSTPYVPYSLYSHWSRKKVNVQIK